MQLKQTVLTLALVGLFATQAHASEMQVEAAVQSVEPVAAFSDTDMQALFGTSDKPMQLAALPQQEMVETEGAWLNFAVGSTLGLATHAFVHRQNMTWRSAAIATGTGALTGGVGGALIRVSGGGIAGNLAWRLNMLAANFGFWQINNPSRR